MSIQHQELCFSRRIGNAAVERDARSIGPQIFKNFRQRLDGDAAPPQLFLRIVRVAQGNAIMSANIHKHTVAPIVE
jgi:hypothetical protein